MADVAFITGRLVETKEDSKELWKDKISTRLSAILIGAVKVLAAEVVEKAVGMSGVKIIHPNGQFAAVFTKQFHSNL